MEGQVFAYGVGGGGSGLGLSGSGGGVEDVDEEVAMLYADHVIDSEKVKIDIETMGEARFMDMFGWRTDEAAVIIC